MITSAKLAALLTGVIGYSLLIGAGGWLLFARTGLLAAMRQSDIMALVPFEWLTKMALLGYVSLVAGLGMMGLIAQFAYVFSRLFARFQGLAMAWSWFLIVWMMGWFGDIGGRLLAWMPDFKVRVLHVFGGVPEFRVVTIESGPFWALALFAVGLFALLNLTLERAVEV